jgi:predicted transglutaminase-like cysteine proteinase
LPSYIINPPSVIPIDVGRQLFVDDFLIQQTTMTRTQHQPVMYPLNPVLAPGAEDTAGFAMPFSDGVWFDPSDQLFKMWFYCGPGNTTCYAYSSDGKTWTRPSLPQAAIPNTDQVLVAAPGQPGITGLTVWMDLQDPNPARKFKAFASDSTSPAYLFFSPDGIQWAANNRSTYPIPMYDRTTYFWNPFRNMWIDSLKTYTGLAAGTTRPAYTSRARDYTESQNLATWMPAQPQDNGNYWTGPDVTDPPYLNQPGGSYPQLYNLDAVAYESLIVGLFSWFYPGPGDTDTGNLPGPDIVEVGVGFSRDGFQWVRPTRGSGPGANGAFLPASNVAGTWNMGNTQSAGGCFLVVGDELWFYFSGRTGQHENPNVTGSTGLASLRRDGFYSMDAGSIPATLTTRPVQFSGRYLFVNVSDPQGSLQIQVVNPDNGSVLATSLPITGVDKTLQPVLWDGVADLSAFANEPVAFQFTLTNGELYSFWVSASTAGASNGYVAANGPGFSGPTDTLGTAAYPATVATPEIFPAGGIVTSSSNITIISRTLGATINYTTDGSAPTATSPIYAGPFQLPASATVNAMASELGLGNSSIATQSFTADNTPPSVAIAAPTNAQTVSGTFTLSASATDDTGIANVQFIVDGITLGKVTGSPYTLTFQTTTLANGSHQVTAIATDLAGNSANSAPVTFSIANTVGGPLGGYWSFDSAYVSGTTIFDQSGYNNSATAYSTTSVPGVSGQALQFNGSSSLTQVVSSLSNELYDLVNDLSLSLWIQTTNASQTEALLSRYDAGGSGTGYLLRINPAGTAELLLGAANLAAGSALVSDVTKINDGNWHHLAVVIRLGNSVTFFVDGALSSSQAINSIPAPSASHFQMGLNPWIPYGNYFFGLMDEVRIYDRALSASDVVSLYNSVNITQPVVTGQPQSLTIAAGAPATFSLTAAGGGLGYQWESEAPGAASFVPISGATGRSYTTPPATLSGSGTQYMCVVTNTAGSASSSAATLTVLANLPSTNYVTSNVSGTLRNNFGGWVGMKITVGGSPITVTALGRIFAAGDSGSHTVKIVNASSSQDVSGGSASVSMTGSAPGSFVYANLSAAVTLNANTAYYIVSQETQNGDTWYDINTTIQTAGVAAETTGVYSYDGATYLTLGSANHSYGPVDLLYAVSVTQPMITQQPQSQTVSAGMAATFSVSATGGNLSYQWESAPAGSSSFTPIGGAAGSSYTASATTLAQSGTQYMCVVSNTAGSASSSAATLSVVASLPTANYVTSKTLGTLRNNFGGWVGMKITVGGSPIAVTTLGRMFAAGDSSSHTVKIVNASSSQDVSGGSASVSMTGSAPGSFVYANLSAAVTLNANTAYYIVSQETQNGDAWYDINTTIQTAGVAAETTGVYSSDGATYLTLGSADHSYGPVDLLYAVSVTQPMITRQPQSQTVSAGMGATFSVSATGGNLSYQWESAPAGSSSFSPIGGAAGSSYTASATTLAQSGTQYMCVVSNTAGSIPSSAAALTVMANLPTASSAFATSAVLGTPRNNFSGWVGMSITVAGSPLTVSALGRIVAPGDSGIHTLKLVNASTGQDVIGGSVSVATSGGSAGSFLYANLATPVTLSAGTPYYVMSQETQSEDPWYDINTTLQTAGVAAETTGIYSYNGTTYLTYGSANQSYGPVNFLYAVSVTQPMITQQPQSQTVSAGMGATFSVSATGGNLSYQWESAPAGSSLFTPISGAAGSSYTASATTLAQSGMQYMCVVSNTAGSASSSAATLSVVASLPTANYVTSKTLGTLRNNFGGWVGMKITVGGTPITVTALGRIFAAGDSGSHTVKIVNASSSQDVSGGSASVSMVGSAPGSFVYANLSAAVTLNANTAYYIVSQETQNGDTWYDINTTIQTAGVAAETTGVYSPDGATYLTFGSANHSYGPVDFLTATGL